MVALTALGLVLPSLASARVWHVLADSTGDAPFLAAAVDSAADDDVIELGPGEFPVEGHSLRFQKSLEFVGAGAEMTTVLGGLGIIDLDGVQSCAVRDLRMMPGLARHDLLLMQQVDEFEAERCIFFGGTDNGWSRPSPSLGRTPDSGVRCAHCSQLGPRVPFP
ncbi:MAG: hypothetical protein R3E12_12465 [Candidatus Eisenbacteria bacterium]